MRACIVFVVDRGPGPALSARRPVSSRPVPSHPVPSRSVPFRRVVSHRAVRHPLSTAVSASPPARLLASVPPHVEPFALRSDQGALPSLLPAFLPACLPASLIADLPLLLLPLPSSPPSPPPALPPPLLFTPYRASFSFFPIQCILHFVSPVVTLAILIAHSLFFNSISFSPSVTYSQIL